MSGTVAPDDGLRGRAIRGVGWVIVEKWGVRIVGLVVFAILARLLSPADFGLLSLATVCTALMSVFVDSGFSKSLIQRKALAPKDASTAFWTSLGLAVAVYAVLAALAPLLATLFDDARLAPVLWVLGAALPIGALSSTPTALLEREFDFRALSMRTLIGTVAGALVSIPMALLGAGVWALVAQPLVTATVGVIALWSSTPWRPRFEYSRQSLRDLYGLGVGVLGIELLNTLQGNTDKLLIGAFFDPTVLGYYYIGQRALMTLYDLTTVVLARVSLTTFSRVQEDRVRTNSALQKMTFASASIALPVFGVMAMLAPQIIPFVFGADWGPSVLVFQLLAFSAAFTSVISYDQNLLLAAGRPRAAFLLVLGQNLLGIALIFAAIPWGIAGVAASRSIRVLVYWPVRLMTLRRAAGIRIGPYVKQVALVVAALVPVLIGIGLLQLTPWADLPGSFFTFALPVGVAAVLVDAALSWWLMGAANRAFVRDLARPVVARLRRRRAGGAAGAAGGA